MDIKRFDEIWREVNAILEKLRACSDLAERHDFVLALKLRVAEIESLSADSINKLQRIELS